MRLYMSYNDYFNYAPFELYVPDYYQPTMSEFIVSGEIPPVGVPFYVDQRVKANYPIKYMVDMRSGDRPVCFEIIEGKDSLIIMHIIDGYIMECQPLVQQQNPTVISYLRKVYNLRKDIYHVFSATLNRNPDLKQQYLDSNGGIVQRMLNLTAPSVQGGNQRAGMNPIADLFYPPYPLPEEEKAKQVPDHILKEINATGPEPTNFNGPVQFVPNSPQSIANAQNGPAFSSPTQPVPMNPFNPFGGYSA